MLSNGEEISVAKVNALMLVRTFATIAFYKFYALTNNNFHLRARNVCKLTKNLPSFFWLLMIFCCRTTYIMFNYSLISSHITLTNINLKIIRGFRLSSCLMGNNMF
jgi:hypothetical protein